MNTNDSIVTRRSRKSTKARIKFSAPSLPATSLHTEPCHERARHGACHGRSTRHRTSDCHRAWPRRIRRGAHRSSWPALASCCPVQTAQVGGGAGPVTQQGLLHILAAVEPVRAVGNEPADRERWDFCSL